MPLLFALHLHTNLEMLLFQVVLTYIGLDQVYVTYDWFYSVREVMLPIRVECMCVVEDEDDSQDNLEDIFYNEHVEEKT